MYSGEIGGAENRTSLSQSCMIPSPPESRISFLRMGFGVATGWAVE